MRSSDREAASQNDVPEDRRAFDSLRANFSRRSSGRAEPRWNQQQSLLVPTIVVSGVLFWRRTAIGYVAAGIVSVMGSLVLFNLLLSAFQANAGVAGVNAFPPEGVAMTVGMVASAVLLLGRSTKGPEATTDDRRHRRPARVTCDVRSLAARPHGIGARSVRLHRPDIVGGSADSRAPGGRRP